VCGFGRFSWLTLSRSSRPAGCVGRFGRVLGRRGITGVLMWQIWLALRAWGLRPSTPRSAGARVLAVSEARRGLRPHTPGPSAVARVWQAGASRPSRRQRLESASAHLGATFRWRSADCSAWSFTHAHTTNVPVYVYRDRVHACLGSVSIPICLG
jgi:hypothetical protein